MIKLKYKLFPQSFVNKIVKTIRLSENSDIAKSNLKNKFGLDDLEVKYILAYKLKYLIELVNTNNVREFVRRLETIHSLDGCIGLETITRILKENNISYKEYETTDYEYYNKKGSKLTSPTCDRIDWREVNIFFIKKLYLIFFLKARQNNPHLIIFTKRG